MKRTPPLERASRIKGICDHIARHHCDIVRVPDLAQRAGLSPFHFIRVFRQETGLTPHQYLRRCRLERARDLLTTTPLPVTEICDAVGWSSLGSFSRTFHRATGETPNTYRKRRRHTPNIPACFLRMYRTG